MTRPQHSHLRYISAVLTILFVLSHAAAGPLSPTKSLVAAQDKSEAHVVRRGNDTQAVATGTPTAIGSHHTAHRTHTAKPSSTHKSKSGNSSCLLQGTTPAKTKTNGARSKRNALTHPRANAGTITLFHGTHDMKNANNLKHPDLTYTEEYGDFNSALKGSDRDPGGFYLTDSLVAAAQFVCYGDINEEERPKQVVVIEYTWTPGTYSSDIYEFTSKTEQYEDFVNANLHYTRPDMRDSAKEKSAEEILQNSVMITGPMDLAEDGEYILASMFINATTNWNFLADKDLTNDFWQYAIIDQQALDNGLEYVTVYDGILCSQIPKANGLSSEIYAQGQKTNDKFSQTVHDLQTPGCSLST